MVRRATRYRPEDRYPHVAALQAALQEALPALPTAPEGSPPLGSLPADRVASLSSLAEPSSTGSLSAPRPPSPHGKTRSTAAKAVRRSPATDTRERKPLVPSPHPYAEDDGADEFLVPDSRAWLLAAALGPAALAAAAAGLVWLTREQAPGERPPEPASPSSAQVRVTGDALQVQLQDDAGGTHAPGSLATGHYRVLARFAGQPQPSPVAELDLVSGQDLVLVCRADEGTCRPER